LIIVLKLLIINYLFKRLREKKNATDRFQETRKRCSIFDRLWSTVKFLSDRYRDKYFIWYIY